MELTFGPSHYVPVLRWKPAEVGALSMLTEATKDRVTPLIELCPSAFVQKEAIKPKKSPPSKIEDILFSKIENLSGSIGASPLFIDLRHLPDSIACSTGEHIWDALSRKGTSVGLTVVPVTGFYGKRIGSSGNGCGSSQELWVRSRH